MFTPPPAVPAHDVVAGPVLSRHRMVWVQNPPRALVVRVQERDGRVHRVARFAAPAGADQDQGLVAFAVRGRQVALVRSVEQSYPYVPCVAPAPYACVSPVPAPARLFAEFDRGRFGHVKRVVRTQNSCRVPYRLAFSSAGLISGDCRGIHLGTRVLSTSSLTDAAGPWVAWRSQTSNATVVRRVDGRTGGYTAPGIDARLSPNGTLAVYTAFGGDGLCGTGTVLGVQLSTPSHPPGGPVIRDVMSPAPFGSALAVSHLTSECPTRSEPAVVTADGTVTPVGPATTSQIGPLAMDAEEVAVLSDDGLHRYARP